MTKTRLIYMEVSQVLVSVWKQGGGRGMADVGDKRRGGGVTIGKDRWSKVVER